jgi:hypothetical protein
MPDEIIPADGDEPTVSPADAGNPPATPEDAGAKDQSDSKPVKTSSDFARERILKKENERLKAEKEQKKEDDDLDPSEVETVDKVIKKHY